MWDLIVSVPDHCLSFYFKYPVVYAIDRTKAVVLVLFLFFFCGYVVFISGRFMLSLALLFILVSFCVSPV